MLLRRQWKELARVFLEMNRHRHLNLEWIPFDLGTKAIKGIAEWDLRWLKDAWILKPLKFAAGKQRWEKLMDEKVTHWPHSFGEYISYAVRYTGAHANAYDEAKMEEIISGMEQMGLFINHHEYAHDLRNEFKTLGISDHGRSFANIGLCFLRLPLLPPPRRR